MSSLLPSLPTAPVIRHSSELHSDPCCDKAEQVKREIETLIDLNHSQHLFMQLGYMWLLSPWEVESSRAARLFLAVFWFAAVSSRQTELFFLALAEVNHSTLTIFALPLYKRRGTRPTDPITSLSGNKCPTIQPYWVWEINPFHSRALSAHLFGAQQGRCRCDYYCSTSNIPTACRNEFIGYFPRPFAFWFHFFIFSAAIIVSSFCYFIFHIFVGSVCMCVCKRMCVLPGRHK